ncbi:MAG: response regulator transcription factor [Burkholderiaceae bacterium]
MRVLLVEDDAMIGASVRAGLRQEGFAIDWVTDGGAAENALKVRHGADAYDLVLLDLGLPKKSGLDVLRSLRGRGDAVPVLIMTARDAVADRVAGLDAGADDYLVKPFDLDELAARVRALHRRRSGRAETLLRHVFGDDTITVDPARRQVRRNGAAVALSSREFAVLEALLERAGAVLSRAQLEEKLYGWDEEPGSNTIEVYVHGLRKKLGAELIRNVRGVGYTIVNR